MKIGGIHFYLISYWNNEWLWIPSNEIPNEFVSHDDIFLKEGQFKDF